MEKVLTACIFLGVAVFAFLVSVVGYVIVLELQATRPRVPNAETPVEAPLNDINLNMGDKLEFGEPLPEHWVSQDQQANYTCYYEGKELPCEKWCILMFTEENK